MEEAVLEVLTDLAPGVVIAVEVEALILVEKTEPLEGVVGFDKFGFTLTVS